jgi:hypothetical protein
MKNKSITHSYFFCTRNWPVNNNDSIQFTGLGNNSMETEGPSSSTQTKNPTLNDLEVKLVYFYPTPLHALHISYCNLQT